MYGSRRVDDEMQFIRPRTVRFYPDERQNQAIPTYQPPKSGVYAASKLNGVNPVKPKVISEEHEPWQKRIFDPGSDFILNWNRFFLISCLAALFIDPMYFYLPAIYYGETTSCVKTDWHLGIVVTIFRTLADLLYAIHIVIKFRTAYVAPNTRVFGRGELVTHPKRIARRYLRSDFIIDLAAALPLPQVLGAIWYLLSVDRQHTCWQSYCKQEDGAGNTPKCNVRYFDCGFSSSDEQTWANSTGVFANCDATNTSIAFNFGMFQPALMNYAPAEEFVKKYFYSFWWGLQNLSCYGQTLTVSTFIGETLYAICLAVVGLVLFAHLIGNVQTYLQSITARVEEWRLKQRDTEEWMRHRQLPHELRERVRRFVQYKWLATRGVDEESILKSLPADLRRDIQRHLCLDLVRRVPFFSQMDGQLLDAICERLVSSLSTEGTYIVREGDPVTEMLFIIRGKLESSTTNGGRTGFFNSITLMPGNFCGEELLGWALLPKATTSLPSSTRTVKALVEVEAFALRAEDLKFVATQFRRLHSKKLQHAFRLYSPHWRTWAACFIQAAWRRFKRRKMAKELSMRESLSFKSDDSGLDEEESSYPSTAASHPNQNLAVSILASRFSASTRKGAQKVKDMDLLKLQKPDEPDFSAEPFD